MFYRFDYTGFAYVEADNLDEAHEKYLNDDTLYDESSLDNCYKVNECMIDL